MKSRATLPVLPRQPDDSRLSVEARAQMPQIRGNAQALLADLRSWLPPDRLVTAPDDLYAYDCDAQTWDRALPLGVAFPLTTEEVAAVVKACVRHEIPFVPRGAGTGLSGGAVALGSLVISSARMNQIHSVDVANRHAWVGPGVVNAHLSRAILADGLHFAPDPSSGSACTIGGNVAENSGGPHTLKYGVTSNHILALEMVLPDGSVAMLGGAAADGPGYDLVAVFVGSEGTFGIVTKALVRLTPLPEGVKTVLAIFNTVADAGRAVTEILSRGIVPAALEMIDQVTLRAVEAYIHAGFPLDAAAVLLIEVDGLQEELSAQADWVVDACKVCAVREIRVAKDDVERAKLWKGRKQAFGALGRIAPNYYTHDGVIPRTKLPEVLDRIAQLGIQHNVLVANVFHAGDGNLHPVVLYDEREPGVLERVRATGDGILRLVLECGGSLSGEHGIGLEKVGYMSALYSEPDLAEMRRLRDLWNPLGLCNPGKVIPAPGRCADHPGSGTSSRLLLGH